MSTYEKRGLNCEASFLLSIFMKKIERVFNIVVRTNYIEQFKQAAEKTLKFLKKNRMKIVRVTCVAVSAISVAVTVAVTIAVAVKKAEAETIENFPPVVIVEETVEETVEEPVEKTESMVVMASNPASEPVEAPESDVYVSEHTELYEYVRTVSDEYGVDPAIVMAVIKKESNFNAGAVGDSGRSLGLMQVQPRWHGERMSKLGITDLLDPYQNVRVGIDYIAELMNKGKSIEWVLMAYNGGPSYANELWSAGVISKYAYTVMEYSKEF